VLEEAEPSSCLPNIDLSLSILAVGSEVELVCLWCLVWVMGLVEDVVGGQLKEPRESFDAVAPFVRRGPGSYDVTSSRTSKQASLLNYNSTQLNTQRTQSQPVSFSISDLR
jgi:hypothetical protein